ncbi:MAG: hypothetical protein AAFR74_02930 [Pseudomonadota bacterium]
MTEKQTDKLRRWTRLHTLEATILFAIGHPYKQIGRLVGFQGRTVRQHLQAEGLNAALSSEDVFRLAAELRALKAVEGLALAQAGSVEMKRMADLLERVGAVINQDGNEETDGVKSLKQIKEMSDEDLVAYVESLVPGLETKACAGNDAGADGTGSAVPVPDHRACGADAARERDRLAKLALPGWPRRGQDAGGR